jgi:hypothetical protein
MDAITNTLLMQRGRSAPLLARRLKSLPQRLPGIRWNRFDRLEQLNLLNDADYAYNLLFDG